MPFDIPVEAFAVEVGGGAHPVVRSLGDRRLVYVEHRRAVRRSYRRRQLVLAAGLSGAFVVVAAVALAPGGHADPAGAQIAGAQTAGARIGAVEAAGAAGRAAGRGGASSFGPRPVEPPYLRARRGSRPQPSRPPRRPTPAGRAPEDRDQVRIRFPGSPAGTSPLVNDPFLVCTRGYESIDAGGYGAIGSGGLYRGAYQFDQVTWNGTARHLHRFDLVGVRPDLAPPAVQDLLAYSLYRWQGASHWHYRCAGLP